MSKDIFSLDDRIAIVTGGLGQLGRQFSMALAERGARVVVLDVCTNESIISRRFGEQSKSGNFLFIQADVTNRRSLENALERIIDTWGIPDILVNNAALDSPPNSPAEENGPFESYPEASFDQVMEVNLKGVFLCCQVFGGQMAQAGRGTIIMVSSIYGLVSPDQRIYEYRRQDGMPFYKPVAYSISKSGLINLTRYLATYWASSGVRVNTITFAGVFNGQDEKFLHNYLPHVPIGRMAREDEYNGAIVFLASDASSYMTGANLVLDGGWTAW